jgi:AcrR family transcriptional regulator
LVPSAPSVHERLLEAGKQLFAAQGFENTSTAAIARAAGTSESQLVKHFRSKEGLLEAIFDASWRKMSYVFAALDVVRSPRERLRMMLELMLSAFEADPAVKELMLFEGRRLRKEGARVVLTDGYLRFLKKVDSILEDIARQGHLRCDVSVQAVRSALIGTLEGMLRDQAVAQRMGAPNVSTVEEIRTVFSTMLEGFLGPEKT